MRRIYVCTCGMRNYARGMLFSPCIREVNSSYRDSATSYSKWGIYWLQGNSRVVPLIRVVPTGPKRLRLILLDFLSKNIWVFLSLIRFVISRFPLPQSRYLTYLTLRYQLITLKVDDTVTRRLKTVIRSEKCVVRRFRRCVNVIESTYTNADSIAYYTPSLYGIAYCS